MRAKRAGPGRGCLKFSSLTTELSSLSSFSSSPSPFAAAVLGDAASAVSITVEVQQQPPSSSRAAAGPPTLVRLFTWRLPAGAALTLLVDAAASEASLLRTKAVPLQALQVVACDILPRLRPGFGGGGGPQGAGVAAAAATTTTAVGGRGGGGGGGPLLGGPVSSLGGLEGSSGRLWGAPPGALFAGDPAVAAAAAASADGVGGRGDPEAGARPGGPSILLWPFSV